ncbi:MAG: thiamine pyrophosphate-binding protein [SAR324 cluster bacterium]|nr:thiamine pyrophosphate-binding protein [SAR324 cluster bacterium]MCZ6628076.1 thiamine pyrophosphate-binding protein [SAR324 cluster bacterium]MCZ6647376.1 thiamine pyrophosphate-binding protein [SAR324 cluster bacterium]MCZ6728769.1 thiamine pyrophosphate-binding protein [SAR324 cluster bacterium]MCZ6842300.1 thiamine pyrophosphate-binding protein [SAR324 cluster bacterium]
MKVMTGRDALLDILEDEGIDHIFGNPGTTELPLMDALVERPNLNYVLALQESVGMAMADGFSRASGKLCAANFHVAPGLGNALGAIYNAKFIGSPVLVTAGQRDHGHGLTEPLLGGNLVEMAKPVVKWATEVEQVQDLPIVMRRAAKLALTPPTGPVFVSLPRDVLLDSAEMELGSPTRLVSGSRPADEVLERLAERLLASENPVIISAQEVCFEDALAELGEVSELIGAPVYTQTVPCLAMFPSDHPHFMGELGKAPAKVRALLDSYDMAFMVGGDGLRFSAPFPGGPLPPGMPLIQLGLEDWALGKNYPSELAIKAGVKETLRALIPVLEAKRNDHQADAVQARSARIRSNNWSVACAEFMSKTEGLSVSKPIMADYLMMQIAKELPEDAVVVEEALTSSANLLKMLPVKDNRRFYGLASGGIGWAVAGAIGVQLAQPDRPVVAVIGDGSSMYSIQALWTAAHLNLPIKFIIANNRSYSILKGRVINLPNSASRAKQQIIGMDFNNPELDFPAMARSMGVNSYQVSEPDDIVPAIRKAMAEDGPVLLDVLIHDGYQSADF